jgi:hypothetical protein
VERNYNRYKFIQTLAEKQVTEETKAPTKVFISYSWDSEDHKERVLALANTLRNPNGRRLSRWCSMAVFLSGFGTNPTRNVL